MIKNARTQWYFERKGIGFEAVDLCLSGLKGRLQMAVVRVEDYCSGRIDRIEELEEPRIFTELQFTNDDENKTVWAGNWRNIATAGSIW